MFKYLNSKVLIIIVSLALLASGQKFAPLQIQQMSITMLYDQSLNSYSMNLQQNYDSDALTTIVYCFKQMATSISVDSSDVESCNLIQTATQYKCIQIDFIRDNTSQLTLTSDWTYFSFSIQKGITQLDKTLLSIDVSITNITRSLSLNSGFLKKQTIYHLLTSTSKDLLDTFQDELTQVKLNYVHTFAHANYYDSLIAQRNAYCFVQQNKNLYLFQGAVLRNGVQHFFTAILTVPTDGLAFHMWGGYSYSTGHAARDMIGYQSHTQNFYDLFSLYAAAPFQDDVSNIVGTKDVVRICNSGDSSKSKTSNPYHFTQFYRMFDTGDTQGDQIIQHKIYNQYCFASYFESYDQQKTFSFSVLDNSYIHKNIACHSPILDLQASSIALPLLVFMISFIFIFF